MGEYLSHKIDAAQRLLLGHSLTDWLVAGIVAIAVWSGLWILRRLMASRYQKYSGAVRPAPIRLITFLVVNTTQLLFLGAALYAAQASLTLPDKLQHAVDNIALMLFLVQVGLWAGLALRFYLEMKELERGADRVFAGSLSIINFIARMLIWSLLILVALENFGVNITALLAGLGVGGVAVALALQNVLGDLGDSALHFELSYFVQQPNLNPLLDLQQAVNFRIIDEFRRLGVEFDYPTQRVILAQPRIADAN
jgi:small-conductance mechanosensitive channel